MRAYPYPEDPPAARDAPEVMVLLETPGEYIPGAAVHCQYPDCGRLADWYRMTDPFGDLAFACLGHAPALHLTLP